MAKEIVKALRTGIWITIAVYIVNFLFGLADIKVSQLFGVVPATGVTGTLGMKVIETLQNMIPFDFMSVLAVYISASLIYLVGAFIYAKVKIPKTVKTWTRVTAILLWGTIPFYILLVGLGLPAMGTLVGVVVYYAVVALSMGLLQDFVTSLKLA